MYQTLGDAATTEHATPPALTGDAAPSTPSGLPASVDAQYEPPESGPLVSALGNHVYRCYTAAEAFKVRDVQPILAECQRLRNGEYDEKRRREFEKHGVPEVWFPITATKCTHASAWFREILLTGDRPYGLTPSAVPELPADAQQAIAAQAVRMVTTATSPTQPPATPDAAFWQAGELRDAADLRLRAEAERRAKRMEDYTAKQMVQGGFEEEFDKFIDELCTYPTAFMVDEVRMVKRERWNGTTIEVVEEPLLCPTYYSAWDVYPSPLCSGVGNGYLITRRQTTNEELQRCIGAEGYNADAIRSVLNEPSASMVAQRPYDTDRLMGEHKDLVAVSGSADERIEVLTFYGSVRGEWLTEWDPDFVLPSGEKPINTQWYPACIVAAGQSHVVIKAMLNPDPLGRWPVYAASFFDVPGSIWGEALPKRMQMLQIGINGLFRGLMDNVGYAVAPQQQVQIARIMPEHARAVLNLMPKRTVFTKPNLLTNDAAIHYDSLPLVADRLTRIINAFLDHVDELTGIPRFISGDNRGAPDTAAGLNMLMNAASKTIRQVISRVGKQVVAQMMRRRVALNNANAPDPAIKGDCDVVAQGVMAILVRDQVAQKRDGLMQLVFTNPQAFSIVGPLGAARLLRARASEAGLYDIVPTDDEIMQRAAAAVSAAPGGPAARPSPQPTPAGAPAAPQPATSAA